jgi:hypothetical protein
MANIHVHDGDHAVPQITSADTLYIRFQLQDSSAGQPQGVAGILYSAVTVAYAKPGETAFTAFPSFGTANWQEVTTAGASTGLGGDYELILRGATAGELALLNTTGSLSFDITSTSAGAFPQKRVRITLALPTANILTGLAQAGASGSVTLPATASASNTYYPNQIVEIVAGTGAGQARVITAYNGTTKVATVGVAWSTTPDSTSMVVVSYARHGLMGTDGAYLMSTDDQATAYAKIAKAGMGRWIITPSAAPNVAGTATLVMYDLAGNVLETLYLDRFTDDGKAPLERRLTP